MTAVKTMLIFTLKTRWQEFTIKEVVVDNQLVTSRTTTASVLTEALRLLPELRSQISLPKPSGL